MKFLFLFILMLGVGTGFVGCEDDNDDDTSQDGATTNAVTLTVSNPTLTPVTLDPDISGLWELSTVDSHTNGTYDA